MNEKNQLTIHDIHLLALLFIAIAALNVPLLVRSRVAMEREQCGNNLRQLWKMENVYMASQGGCMKLYPPQTGGAFWLHLNMGTRRLQLIDDSALDIYFCPVSGNIPVKGKTDYLGPRLNVQQLGSNDWIGADHPDNHGSWASHGSNGLLKSGNILYLGPDEFSIVAKSCLP